MDKRGELEYVDYEVKLDGPVLLVPSDRPENVARQEQLA
jgi:hypothetical protein